MNDVQLTEEDLIDLFETSCSAGAYDVVLELLHKKEINEETLNEGLCMASQEGRARVVRLLLSFSSLVDPTKENYKAVKLALQSNQIEVVKLFLAHSSMIASFGDNYGLRCTALEGYEEILSLLLLDPLVNPNISDCFPFRSAAQNGHLNIVKKLSESVSQTAYEWALRTVITGGHVEILRYLLSSKLLSNVDINVMNENFILCCVGGNVELTKLILSCDIVDPSFNNNEAVKKTCVEGHRAVLELLCKDARVDVSSEDSICIHLASEENKVDVLQYLLSIPNMNPGSDNNYAIRIASQKGNIEIVKLLIKDERVDPTVDDNFPLAVASHLGFVEIVALLQSEKPLPSIPSSQNNENNDSEMRVEVKKENTSNEKSFTVLVSYREDNIRCIIEADSMEKFEEEIKKKAKIEEENFGILFWDNDFSEWVFVKDFLSIPSLKLKIKITTK